MKLTAPSMEYDKQIHEYRREFLEYGGSMDGCSSLRRFDKFNRLLIHFHYGVVDSRCILIYTFIRKLSI